MGAFLPLPTAVVLLFICFISGFLHNIYNYKNGFWEEKILKSLDVGIMEMFIFL